MRFFIEDCDSLQGFQLIIDASDGISGLGARLLEQLADDHSAKCAISFPVSPGHWGGSGSGGGVGGKSRENNSSASMSSRVHRVSNVACAMHALTNYCDLVVPLTCGSSFYANDPQNRFPRQFPNTNLKPIYYHTSAVLAAAIESITSVYRRYDDPIAMAEMADVIGISGRLVAEANLALPFPIDAVSGRLVMVRWIIFFHEIFMFCEEQSFYRSTTCRRQKF